MHSAYIIQNVVTPLSLACKCAKLSIRNEKKSLLYECLLT